MKIQNEEDAYKFLSQPIIMINPRKYTIKEIVDLVKIRYSVEFLELNFLDNEKFYDKVYDNIKTLFNIIESCKYNELASSLIELLDEHYCKKDLYLPVARWFLAAIIHVCFDYLKETSEAFIISFKRFSKDDGSYSIFCRAVIIFSIEFYCRIESSDCHESYGTVIRYDGEVIQYLKEDSSKVIKTLWIKKCREKNININIECLDSFYNVLLKRDIMRTVYWQKRPKIKTGG